MAHVGITLIDGSTRRVHEKADVQALFNERLINDAWAENAVALIDRSALDPLDPAFGAIGSEANALVASWAVARGTADSATPIEEQVTGQLTGGLDDEVLTTRERALLEQEQFPERPFRQFLATQPFGQLSAAGNRALQGGFSPALASFRLQGGPEDLFADFLRQTGRQNLSPSQIGSRLTGLGNLIGQGETIEDVTAAGEGGAFTADQSELLNRFLSNQTAFETALNPRLGRVNPMFRGGVQAIGQRIFDRFQGETPDLPFLRFLSQRGGNIFGPLANPLAGFN